jgi:hypothetical protein
MGTVGSNSSNRQTGKQYEAEPGFRPISLLSFLEAKNVRLREAIVQLSLDAKTLREALNRMEARPGRDCFYRPSEPAKAALASEECENALPVTCSNR